VADSDAVFAAADRIATEWGGIDVWINNAMATIFGPNELVSPAEFKRVTEVTYLGAVHGTLAALRHMRREDTGTIVQIGSALAYRAIPLQGPYCAAKFALRGFTDSLRSELIHDGSDIRLTMVQLPGVNTPQFEWSRTVIGRRHRPVGAVLQPEAVAEAIFKAVQRAPREVWVGLPAAQAIIGGMVAPGLLDRHLASAAYEDQIAASVENDAEGILFEPAARDHGSSGPFTGEAGSGAIAINPTALRIGLGAALGLTAGALVLGRLRRRG
jgi:NAD(P)-dependent dehydrogenase (short-subunit alcohol dehydrogenase family)